MFAPAVKTLPADKRNLRFHDLRHTCASLLVAAETPMLYVKERLGQPAARRRSTSTGTCSPRWRPASPTRSTACTRVRRRVSRTCLRLCTQQARAKPPPGIPPSRGGVPNIKIRARQRPALPAPVVRLFPRLPEAARERPPLPLFRRVVLWVNAPPNNETGGHDAGTTRGSAWPHSRHAGPDDQLTRSFRTGGPGRRSSSRGAGWSSCRPAANRRRRESATRVAVDPRRPGRRATQRRHSA